MAVFGVDDRAAVWMGHRGFESANDLRYCRTAVTPPGDPCHRRHRPWALAFSLRTLKRLCTGANVKILLAIDDSAGSEAAVRAIIEQASERRTQLKVLHVVKSPSAALEFAIEAASQVAGYPATLEPEIAEASKRARGLVQQTVEQLRSEGLQATGTVICGDPKSVIIDTAAQWDADLIVVGARGQSDLERFLTGSVCDAVARHADCSVEIVRPRKNLPTG
jgi:nucleotide-binding universal stress UspA family protein